MKYVLILAIAFSLSACDTKPRGASKVCIDGVTYLQFISGATVQVDRTGKPVSC